MNFLAHLYLSFDDEEIMIGNFIADHVKGKQIEAFSLNIQRGIRLHRAIDAFTDSHELVHLTKQRLRPQFRKYAPVIADVFYDHFLAAEWHTWSDSPLEKFAKNFYSTAFRYQQVLPPRTQRMLPVMSENDWLTSYGTLEGIHAILTAMSSRTSFESGMEFAAAELEKNYNRYKKEFRDFFPELISFSKSELKPGMEQ